jgi:phospholipase C
VLQVIEARGHYDRGELRLQLIDNYGRRGGRGRRRPPVVNAYGAEQPVELHGTEEITVHANHSGGWYDIAITTQSDASFSYQLAGRLESGSQLTSDPQFGRS